MVRILGNNLANKKKIYIALTCIYGIGVPTSRKILKQLNKLGVLFKFDKMILWSKYTANHSIILKLFLIRVFCVN